jgi:hypothetical protein
MWHVSQGRYQRSQQSVVNLLTDPIVDTLVVFVSFLMIPSDLGEHPLVYRCKVQETQYQSSPVDLQTMASVLVYGSRLANDRWAVGSSCSSSALADEIAVNFIPWLGYVVTGLRLPAVDQPDQSLIPCIMELIGDQVCTFEKTEQLERAPIIDITKEFITLDGRLICEVQTMLGEDAMTGPCRAKIIDELVILRKNWKLVHPDEPFQGLSVIGIFKDADFEALQRAMSYVGEAGNNIFQIAIYPGRSYRRWW